MMDTAGRLWRDESAQTLVEYGLLLALIALAAALVMGTLGHQVSSLFSNEAKDL